MAKENKKKEDDSKEDKKKEDDSKEDKNTNDRPALFGRIGFPLLVGMGISTIIHELFFIELRLPVIGIGITLIIAGSVGVYMMFMNSRIAKELNDKLDGISSKLDKLDDIESNVKKLDGIATDVKKLDGIATDVKKLDKLDDMTGKLDDMTTLLTSIDSTLKKVMNKDSTQPSNNI